MSDRFAQLLLREGRLRVGAAPYWTPTSEERLELAAALRDASLHLPGPPLTPSLDLLSKALGVVHRAAWRFLHGDGAPPRDDPALRMPHGPQAPADHWAADLALRFLPGLHQRIVRRDPDDPLAEVLAEILRHWPLSGVLADLTEGPETPVDFGGHPGLSFLYAERLAARERPAWIPTGAARGGVEVVYAALGKPLDPP